MCLLETSRHGLLETELLELLADENNLTPPTYKPGDDEPSSTKPETSEPGSSNATDALADKLQEQVNIAYVQTEESKDEQKKKEEEAGKELANRFMRASSQNLLEFPAYFLATARWCICDSIAPQWQFRRLNYYPKEFWGFSSAFS